MLDVPLGSTAVLIIDMQKGYCDPNSAMELTGPGTTNQRAIIPSVARLAQVARQAGLPIFWSQQIHFPNDVTRSRHRIADHTRKRNFIPCLRGTWEVDFADGIAGQVRPEDYLFVKHRSTCFYQTTLEVELRMLGINTLVIAGVNTNYCVESTIRDAYFRDYDIIVLKDCVAGSVADLHEATLKNVELYFGVVTTLAEFDEQLNRQTGVIDIPIREEK